MLLSLDHQLSLLIIPVAWTLWCLQTATASKEIHLVIMTTVHAATSDNVETASLLHETFASLMFSSQLFHTLPFLLPPLLTDSILLTSATESFSEVKCSTGRLAVVDQTNLRKRSSSHLILTLIYIFLKFICADLSSPQPNGKKLWPWKCITTIKGSWKEFKPSPAVRLPLIRSQGHYLRDSNCSKNCKYHL